MTFSDGSGGTGVVSITLSLALAGVGKTACQLWKKSFIKVRLVNAEREGKAALWTWSHPT